LLLLVHEDQQPVGHQGDPLALGVPGLVRRPERPQALRHEVEVGGGVQGDQERPCAPSAPTSDSPGHPDLFSYVGAFSGAGRKVDVRTSYGGVFKDAAAFNKKVRLLWIGAGTAEEGIYKSNRAMHEELDRAGVRSVFVEQTGTAHE
jgi:hypothetical protein